jgi:hypothetical protein
MHHLSLKKLGYLSFGETEAFKAFKTAKQYA